MYNYKKNLKDIIRILRFNIQIKYLNLYIKMEQKSTKVMKMIKYILFMLNVMKLHINN